jgi:hypothetical protein
MVSQDFSVRKKSWLFCLVRWYNFIMKEIMPKIENIRKPESEPREIDTYVYEFCSGWKPETDEEIQVFEETKQKL